jgi:DNA-binding GntR family transcriptional regulator
MVQLQPAYEHPAQVAAEHEELLAAIESGDLGRTEELWRVHLDEAAANQIKALDAAYTEITEEKETD